ncbi:D-alanyl-D-alanine endopeptidase [Marinobacterium nitratireducens]|uniref:D-alanyl-D-alanine endopeptidase n=1 Tax=Marinobacterium nitratireducens TaxID=518897 RepID=A0A917Z762_9GAMM|nr:D-alanyl-D-alanine endopeptidase [Marinobacterium nitratireducens]GGO76974.1 D-alanyl-D-alanine endopeptidase [Marinobacterium nitratireducens]
MKRFRKLSATLCLAAASTLASVQIGAAERQPQLASVSTSVIDLESGKSLVSKNDDLVVPIASITKLMTAMVILDAGQPLDEPVRIDQRDRELAHNYYSRIRTGSELPRGDLLRIMLMSSENLAATTLATHYPGGFDAFVKAMNAKAQSLGMTHSRFVGPSGLSPDNVSSASDLARMVKAAVDYRLIREYSTTSVYTANFDRPRYRVGYTNTNALVRAGKWDIRLSKTGYLDEAGRCLVMVASVDGRQVAMIMLDSFGKLSPVGDANRIRKWLETGNVSEIASAAANYERRKTATLMAR